VDYLKARPPPGRLHSPLPPTISFPKSVARIIKLVEERRERGGEGDRRKKRLLPLPPNLVRQATRPLSFRNLHAFYLDLSLHPLVFPLSAHFVPILRPFWLPLSRASLSLSLSLSLSSMLFCFNLEVFAKELIGDERVASFEFRPRVYERHRSENLFSISATPTGSRSIRVMYRVISK